MALLIACVIDPLATLQSDHDTSLAVLREAQVRGHDARVCELGDLSARDGRLFLRTTGLGGGAPGELKPADQFDLLFMRKDPPVDRAYLAATHLLDMAGTVVWNDPSGLREASEKLFAFRFPGVTPPSLATQSRGDLLHFLKEMGGKIVVKPLDGYAGKGVFLVSADDPNRGAILETATEDWRRPVLAQKYLPEIAKGDKRILLLEGEPLGACVRLAQDGQLRANMAAGGRVVKGEVTARDRRLIEAIRPGLLEWGLHFVGIDVIGDYLTEINVTSPTMLQEISRLDGQNLAARVVQRWEELLG